MGKAPERLAWRRCICLQPPRLLPQTACDRFANVTVPSALSGGRTSTASSTSSTRVPTAKSAAPTTSVEALCQAVALHAGQFELVPHWHHHATLLAAQSVVVLDDSAKTGQSQAAVASVLVTSGVALCRIKFAALVVSGVPPASTQTPGTITPCRFMPGGLAWAAARRSALLRRCCASPATPPQRGCARAAARARPHPPWAPRRRPSTRQRRSCSAL